MGDYSQYNLYCVTEAAQKTFFSTTVPTTCPTNAAHTIDPDSIYISLAPVPGQYYYEEAATACATQCVVGLLPNNKVSCGFGVPSKFTFEGRSAVNTTTGMVGSSMVVIWGAPMSTPTANNGFVVVATLTTSPYNMTFGTPVCFTGT